VPQADEADYSPPASVRRQMTRDVPTTATLTDFSALELLATTAVALEEHEAREQALQERREAADAAAPAADDVQLSVDQLASSAVAEVEHAVDVGMDIDARSLGVAQCSTSSCVDKMEGDVMESEAPQGEMSTSEPGSGLVVISERTAVTAVQRPKAFEENAYTPAKATEQVLTAWTGHSEAPLGVLQPMGC
jgi:hypothetical protein